MIFFLLPPVTFTLVSDYHSLVLAVRSDLLSVLKLALSSHGFSVLPSTLSDRDHYGRRFNNVELKLWKRHLHVYRVNWEPYRDAGYEFMGVEQAQGFTAFSSSQHGHHACTEAGSSNSPYQSGHHTSEDTGDKVDDFLRTAADGFNAEISLFAPAEDTGDQPV
ncbi:hypothetical protein K1719_002363 [Acacia pycnantha]|nr:hypothetical protein K1719_002363 [Acacia pycnantha]